MNKKNGEYKPWGFSRGNPNFATWILFQGATQKKTAGFTNHESFGIGKNPKALRTEGPSFRKSAWWCNVPILKNDGVRQWVSDDIPFL